MFSKKPDVQKKAASAPLAELIRRKDSQAQLAYQYQAQATEATNQVRKIQNQILLQAASEKYYEPLSRLQEVFSAAAARHQDWVEFYNITLFCSDGSVYTLIDKGPSLFYLATSDNDPLASLVATLAPEKTFSGVLTYSYLHEKDTYHLDIFTGELRIMTLKNPGDILPSEISKQVVGFASLFLHPRGIKNWDKILSLPKTPTEPLSPQGMVPFFTQLTTALPSPLQQEITEDFFSADPRENSSVKLSSDMESAISALDERLSKEFSYSPLSTPKKRVIKKRKDSDGGDDSDPPDDPMKYDA